MINITIYGIIYQYYVLYCGIIINNGTKVQDFIIMVNELALSGISVSQKLYKLIKARSAGRYKNRLILAPFMVYVTMYMTKKYSLKLNTKFTFTFLK